MPGWQTPTTDARTWADLPQAARDYVEVSILTWPSVTNSVADHPQYIEKFVGVKVSGRAY